MIIFLIIFMISSMLYYFYGGSKSLDDFVQKASKDENIINILKSSQDIQEEPDNDKKIPFQGNNNPSSDDKESSKPGERDNGSSSNGSILGEKGPTNDPHNEPKGKKGKMKKTSNTCIQKASSNNENN